jgi:hypothetical protein
MAKLLSFASTAETDGTDGKVAGFLAGGAGYLSALAVVLCRCVASLRPSSLSLPPRQEHP